MFLLKRHVITKLLEVWKKEITSWGKDNESALLYQNCSGEIMGAEYTQCITHRYFKNAPCKHCSKYCTQARNSKVRNLEPDFTCP